MGFLSFSRQKSMEQSCVSVVMAWRSQYLLHTAGLMPHRIRSCRNFLDAHEADTHHLWTGRQHALDSLYLTGPRVGILIPSEALPAQYILCHTGW